MNLAWILCKTSHSGNVGSAARAIKTMGFADLILVAPKDPGVKASEQALALASGAQDVLDDTHIVDDLKTACNPFQWVFGLSSRDREFGPPCISLKEACVFAELAITSGQSCAFLFGTERTGLENEDFNSCTHRVWIDANPNYSSLNLAQAVMVCAYEMRQTQLLASENLSKTQILDQPAPQEAIQAAMTHLQDGLEAIGFLDAKHPKKLMERLRALFSRAGLQTEEVDILRGIAKQMLLK